MPYAARITVFCRMLYAKPRRGPKSCLSHGMRYWETQPRHTLTFGKSAGKVTPFSVYGVLKFGGNGAFWFLPLGISSVSVSMLKLDWRANCSPIGDQSSQADRELWPSLRALVADRRPKLVAKAIIHGQLGCDLPVVLDVEVVGLPRRRDEVGGRDLPVIERA